VTWRDAVTAAPDFAIAGACLATWVAPTRIGTPRIGDLLLLMLIEFIVVHSAAFMGNAAYADAPRTTRAKRVLGLGVFYTLFVVGFAAGFKTWWPLIGFWALTLNRLLGALVGQAPSGTERQLIQRGWGVGALFYLLAVMITAFAPVPAFGIDAAAIQAANLPSSGLWVEQPYRVVAAAFLYFTARGLSELAGHRWVKGTGRHRGA
jgi:hypothetical protein